MWTKSEPSNTFADQTWQASAQDGLAWIQVLSSHAQLVQVVASLSCLLLMLALQELHPGQAIRVGYLGIHSRSP